ncbi:cytochrome c-type biogenesis protein [Pseudoalteromonas tunicata]|uniref:Cytochrome c-type biogenesis protein n=1 Tax=Pseudoalteromonas tunicata D2 TaxID=87626 RepID=A4C697_9GAMM|nr:cytochrome c-type biogenesis protein [Pseudoalteromonas tunicata]ATC95476.1 cytochrome c-type biogenesis protein CcmH [Pseudoalteromonas tunicata]AXT31050.1 cytochrome c-type biogenesis protein CcmH [Pseudoalteromonas tunicata]EAR29501.1 cytochrome c-type biogenesis protein CcmH [Pseudoalteromonas tunicata D2]MDP4982569.1 cytochrome c-type biogenesis protein CcmH [Pseudoalteromonas tunicata]MDP5212405.1 cytochrome c-type biogenesis protein CcmH [Pseudoalteromonas tunicata]
MKYLIAILLSLVSTFIVASEDKYQFETKEQASIFSELTHELRCPKCQNQNIADSDAIVAKDLRDKVLVLVEEGKGKQEIIDYMIDRYGYFVHYKPPVTASTLVLWVLPVLFVVFGFISILLRQKKASKNQPWTEQDEATLVQLIAQYQRKEPK